mmetsp:Transcript_8386/g.13264  ORF Transcript_8386/g.13264 Transcript_8386/m.13264 type:complete len:419 (+) Transcript_8386:105-1361(+)
MITGHWCHYVSFKSPVLIFTLVLISTASFLLYITEALPDPAVLWGDSQPSSTVGGSDCIKPSQLNTEPHGMHWLQNLSSGIPTELRGQTYIAMSLCCSREAQQETQKEFKGRKESHDHRYKRYDIASVLSGLLWQLQANVSIAVVLAYVGSSKESQTTLNQTKEMFQEALAGQGGGVRIWEYDVSWASNPSAACVRAGQMGRMYLHESGLLQDNDIAITSDADTFPVRASALLPFLHETNPNGEYYRIFMKDFEGDVRRKYSISLILTGQSIGDWRNSLSITGLPRLHDAIQLSIDGLSLHSPWDIDQTILTRALMNSELCKFPDAYDMWGKGKELEIVTQNSTTASIDRDIFTCMKGKIGVEYQCLNQFNPRKGCLYAHFLPDATPQSFIGVYNQIAAATLAGKSYKSAEQAVGKYI